MIKNNDNNNNNKFDFLITVKEFIDRGRIKFVYMYFFVN